MPYIMYTVFILSEFIAGRPFIDQREIVFKIYLEPNVFMNATHVYSKKH